VPPVLLQTFPKAMTPALVQTLYTVFFFIILLISTTFLVSVSYLIYMQFQNIRSSRADRDRKFGKTLLDTPRSMTNKLIEEIAAMRSVSETAACDESESEGKGQVVRRNDDDDFKMVLNSAEPGYKKREVPEVKAAA
jgi:ABC-type multidrug transport system fused ATPase/permease subunit